MADFPRLRGLVAAAYTPFRKDGSLETTRIAPLVEHVLSQGVTGLYVCGSTGEGMSMTGAERKQVAEAFVTAVAGRVPVVVQVGHNSLGEAAELARHAEAIGADMVSATCPSYFAVDSVEGLVATMAEVARAAPRLPFYYYHIPRFTGAALDMVDFLQQAASRIPTLAGIKYSDSAVHGFQACLQAFGDQFDLLWGVDEMLLSALVVGAEGAVGSTYNIAGRMYGNLLSAFEHGDLATCRSLQGRSVQLVRTLAKYPFHAAMKEVLRMQGIDCGTCRLPIATLADEQVGTLRDELEQSGMWGTVLAERGVSSVRPSAE